MYIGAYLNSWGWQNHITRNHYSCNSIASIILPGERVERLKESGRYYNREGIEYVLKGLYSGGRGDELLHHAAMPLLYTSMYYLPQSYIINKEVFNYEFNLVYKELFYNLELFSDYVFIDTERNENLSSNAILTEADLVVVNLVQDKIALREFLIIILLYKKRQFILLVHTSQNFYLTIGEYVMNTIFQGKRLELCHIILNYQNLCLKDVYSSF